MSTVAVILERELENHRFAQARLQSALEAMEIGIVYGRERLDLGAERLSEIEEALSAYGDVPANNFESPPYHISGRDVDSLITEAMERMRQEAVRDEGNSGD